MSTRNEPSVPPERDAPPAAPATDRAVVVMAGPLEPETLAKLCAEVERHLIDGDVQVVVCDVERHPESDLRVVETLARLALTARRLGRRIRVRHASRDVQAFLAFAGLADVLPCEGGGDSVEVRR